MVEPVPEVPPEVLTVARAFELAATDREAVGVLAGRPLVAVDLDGVSPAEADLVARSLADRPAVLVGLAHRPHEHRLSPPRFDVLLTDAGGNVGVNAGGGAGVNVGGGAGGDTHPAGPPWRTADEGLPAALAEVAGAVARSPQAATALVQVLRLGRGAGLEAGLTVESLAYAALQSGPEHQAWLAAAARAEGGRRRTHPRPAGAAGRPAVGLERRADTLVVMLQRPEVRNAVDVATRDGLVAAFDLATSDSTLTGVEVRGEGPDFCSGGDLSEFGTLPDPATGHLVRSTRSPARALARCAARTTFHVHGASVGAGLELAALARRVVATPDATFRLPEVAMGLIPGAGGTATIPRRIGPELTAWMALTGRPVDAVTALRWGLVDEVC